MANTINYNNYPPVIHYMGKEYIGGPVNSGGEDVEFFAKGAYVGQPGGSYVYPEYDDSKELDDDAIYVITIYDIANDDVGWVALHWREWIGNYYQGALKTEKGASMTVRLYKDKFGLSQYAGSYRNILGTIYKVSAHPEYFYTEQNDS